MHHRSNASCQHVHAEGAGAFAAGRDQHINLTIRACDRCRTRFVRDDETFCPACVGEIQQEQAKQGVVRFLVVAFVCFYSAGGICVTLGVEQERLISASASLAVVIFMLGACGYVWTRLR